MKRSKFYILTAFVILAFSSCATFGVATLASCNMNQLELRMSKEQVTKILGGDYTIAEKRIEDNNKIEALSYRNYPNNEEFYMFVFKNEKLEKWYRKLLPWERIKNN